MRRKTCLFISILWCIILNMIPCFSNPVCVSGNNIQTELKNMISTQTLAPILIRNKTNIPGRYNVLGQGIENMQHVAYNNQFLYYIDGVLNPNTVVPNMTLTISQQDVLNIITGTYKNPHAYKENSLYIKDNLVLFGVPHGYIYTEVG